MARKAAIMWSRDECVKLIEEYERHECLYAVTSENYRNRNLRRNALESIASALRELRPEVTAELVKTKLITLRAQYCDASQKLRQSRVSGCSSDSVATPTLWCYNMLSFLEQHIVHTKPITSKPQQQRSSGEARASSVPVIDGDTEDDDRIELDEVFEYELLRDEDSQASTSRCPSRETPDTVGEQAIRRSSMDTGRTSREDSRDAPTPQLRRGTKRSADQSPVPSEPFMKECRSTIADLINVPRPKREHDPHDPFYLFSFGKFVATEMLQITDPVAIRRLKTVIIKAIVDEQAASSNNP